MRGNKGEWSELYVLLKLLADGRIYASDEYLSKLDKYFPIKSIKRQEEPNKKIDYVIQDTPNKIIELYINENKVAELQRSKLLQNSVELYKGILNGSDRAFEIIGMDDVMSELKTEKLKAPSTDKTDITMQIHDIETGYEPTVGFSIKSELGNAPTLLNAGKTTNFVYEVKGIDNDTSKDINSINSRNKVIDRITAIYANGGTLTYDHMMNDTFSDNLMFIDSNMEKILSEMILIYYKENISKCVDLLKRLKEDNTMNYRNTMLYEDRLKRFLCSVALGMSPSKEWDGSDEANGGYIVVCEDGEVLAYHLYNRDKFKEYLLNNTKLERASTIRHEYASLYEINGKTYINLNLQIRFI